EEKHDEQRFFDESEIKEANLQPGSGSHTQAHRESRLTKSEEIVTQQTAPLDNIELQSNYSEEEEINEIIKLVVDTYRASDKGSKAWLEH
ncbi:1682_t:CDS:2, partial [Dentiscutata heterogama]